MKRIILACVLLILSATIIIYSSISIKTALSELDSALSAAEHAVSIGDRALAEQYINIFNNTFERYETAFICFLSREMFYNVEFSAKAILYYNTPESESDMLAEIAKTRGAIDIIYKSTFRLI